MRKLLAIAFCLYSIAALAGAGDRGDIERRADLPSQCPANQVIASPNGAAGKPKCRALVASDVPAGGAPGAHASTHLPAGSDPLSTIAPVAVSGTAQAVGTANSFARSDHQHGYNFSGTPVATSTANAAGSSGSPARLDHVHALSAHETTHLPSGSDPLATAAPVTVTGVSNSAGAANSLARSDHQHALGTHEATHLPSGSDPLVTAAPVTVTGTSNSVGSANSLARSDHQHALSYGTPVATGIANAAGASNSVARADHVHATTLPDNTSFMYIWSNPVAFGSTGLSTPLACNSGTNTITGLSNPDVYRNIQVTLGAGWDPTITVTINGTDATGAATNFTASIAGTFQSIDAWKTITNASKSGVGSSAATVTIGPGYYLGIPTGKRQIKVTGAILTVNNVLDSIDTTNSFSNPNADPLIYMTTPPNGARKFIGSFSFAP